MTEYIKVRPSKVEGRIICEMDQAGFEKLKHLIDRAAPRKGDNIIKFNEWRDRAQGLFLAGAVVMKWGRK